MVSKQLTVKLFFNLSNRTFYVQLGDEMLFMVKDKTAGAIQEKEKIEIRHVADVKEIQMLNISDKT